MNATLSCPECRHRTAFCGKATGKVDRWPALRSPPNWRTSGKAIRWHFALRSQTRRCGNSCWRGPASRTHVTSTRHGHQRKAEVT